MRNSSNCIVHYCNDSQFEQTMAEGSPIAQSWWTPLVDTFTVSSFTPSINRTTPWIKTIDGSAPSEKTFQPCFQFRCYLHWPRVKLTRENEEHSMRVWGCVRAFFFYLDGPHGMKLDLNFLFLVLLFFVENSPYSNIPTWNSPLNSEEVVNSHWDPVDIHNKGNILEVQLLNKFYRWVYI